MYLTVGQIETLAVIGIVCWLVYWLFAPPTRTHRKEPEKMCEPWWKSYHL